MLVLGYDQGDQLGSLTYFSDALVDRNVLFQKAIFLGKFKTLLGSIDIKNSNFDVFSWFLELRW